VLIGREFKNQMAEAVAESGFPSGDFSVEETDNEIVLVHRPSESLFALRRNGDGFQGAWTIDGEPDETSMSPSPGVPVGRWLEKLDSVLKMPDLWGDLFGAAGGPDEDDPNTPFDAGEQAEIAGWAADVEQNAAEHYGLNEEQMKALVGELRELVAASGKMGRKDWYKMALGSLMGIALNHVVEAPVAQQVLVGMFSTLGHLFGHPIPQIGPGPLF
jgi:hypothetical protein